VIVGWSHSVNSVFREQHRPNWAYNPGCSGSLQERDQRLS
jgi:hypothetical protein